MLELIECGLSPLACEFLGRCLGPDLLVPLQVLRLDHNDLGPQGMKLLANGLRLNGLLQTLSLSYCNITEQGAHSILEILIYYRSSLQMLDLQGNRLGD